MRCASRAHSHSPIGPWPTKRSATCSTRAPAAANRFERVADRRARNGDTQDEWHGTPVAHRRHDPRPPSTGASAVSKGKWCIALSLVVMSAHAAESDRAIIERQSQQFSDASAAGDGKALGALVDERVIFMNETGEIASKHDLLESTPPPAGVVNKLEQSDLRIELHGDTAVTSFTDHLTQHANGAVRTASF